jgi:ribosomal protein S18 acetylase RimI-like enzyme
VTIVRPAQALPRIEHYYDTAPRANAKTEDIGPFTLFVSSGAWPYYARPRLGHSGGFTATDVDAVRARQEELGVPVSFEWVLETSPGLAEAAEKAGLAVERRPLLVLGEPSRPTPPDGVSILFLDPDDPQFAVAVGAVDLAFGWAGTAVGSAGPAERDKLVSGMRVERVDYMRQLTRRGLIRWAAAVDASGPIGGGSYHPRSEVAEITGIGTIPSARRRGIGAAVTSALVADAATHGVSLSFLSAASVEAASVYERVGFQVVGTACEAMPAPGA